MEDERTREEIIKVRNKADAEGLLLMYPVEEEEDKDEPRARKPFKRIRR